MSADTQMQGGGFMGREWGVLDFAGGDVVHISSGAMLEKGSCLLSPAPLPVVGASLGSAAQPTSSTDT